MVYDQLRFSVLQCGELTIYICVTVMTPFRVSEHQIRLLDEEKLVDLLDLLLTLEAREHSIPLSGIAVSVRTKVPDGGLDGATEWSPPPEKTDFLPGPVVGFQCKASNLTSASCASELIDTAGRLKPSVSELLKRDGAYILFINGSGGVKWNSARQKAIQDKLIQLRVKKKTAARVEVYGADRIKKWVDKHLAAVVFVSGATGHPVFPGLKTWKEWRDGLSTNGAYYADVKTASLRDLIRSQLKVPRKCLRLNGLSGLGKTRLLLEALSPTSDADPLTASVIYLNAQHQVNEIANYLSEWKRLGRDGILVVDNCKKELHESIQNEVVAPSSRFSAITVGLNPDEKISGTEMLVLERADEPQMVDLVKKQVPGVSDADAKRIAHWAGGFPFLGLLLCDAWMRKDGLGSVQLDDLQLSRHLWGDSTAPNDDQADIINVCSLFESIEIGNGDTEEAKFVVSFSGVEARKVMKTLRAFERRGTVERYGGYVRLRPHPLALRLCAEWWRGADKTLIAELLESVPESMINALCERLSTLDFLEEARDVTRQLCGADGPFGDAEVLSSERGARILRALAEIHPEACSNTLCSAIQSLTLDELRFGSLPRRQWVWTLELLMFRETTFLNAIRALQRLAAAETENYSNNATGLWGQSFHLYLSGTQASLKTRLEYASGYFEQEHDDFPQRLFLTAIDKALESDHFSRSGGAEDQGSGPALKEYEPDNDAEILDYWAQMIALALRAVSEDRLDKSALLRVFASRIRGLLRSGATDISDRIVRLGAEWSATPWTEGIDALRDTARFDARPGGDLEVHLRKLLAILEPAKTDLGGRLVTVVSRPSWTDLYEEDATGKHIDVGQQKAELLGEECGLQFDSCAPYLPALFQGEQRMGWAFGRGLARKLSQPEMLIAIASSALKSNLERGVGNPAVLGGFLQELSRSARAAADKAIAAILDDEALRRFGPELLTGMQPSAAQLSQLLRLVRSDALSVSSLAVLGYGRALDHMAPGDVISFASELYDHSLEGSQIGFFVLYMYLHGHPERWIAVRPAMRRFMIDGKLAELETLSTTTLHEWTTISEKILEENDGEVAESLARQLVEMATRGRNRHRDLSREMGTTLLSKYGGICWPILASVLLGKGGVAKWRLANFLRREQHFDEVERLGPIDHLDSGVLNEWLHANPTGASEIAGIVSIVIPRDDSFVFTPVAKWLLDNAGSKEVLSSITTNLLSGSWSGSREPYLLKLRALLATLRSHKVASVRDWAMNLTTAIGNDIAREHREANGRMVGRW